MCPSAGASSMPTGRHVLELIRPAPPCHKLDMAPAVMGSTLYMPKQLQGYGQRLEGVARKAVPSGSVAVGSIQHVRSPEKGAELDMTP